MFCIQSLGFHRFFLNSRSFEFHFVIHLTIGTCHNRLISENQNGVHIFLKIQSQDGFSFFCLFQTKGIILPFRQWNLFPIHQFMNFEASLHICETLAYGIHNFSFFYDGQTLIHLNFPVDPVASINLIAADISCLFVQEFIRILIMQSCGIRIFFFSNLHGCLVGILLFGYIRYRSQKLYYISVLYLKIILKG